MKKIFLLAIAISSGILLIAQSNKEDVDIIQAAFGKEKKEIVAAFIRPEGTQADAFWQLYDEYEAKRKELGKRRLALLENYATNYENMDDARIESTMKEIFKLQAQHDDLIKKYYKKMKKPAGYKAAAQFTHIESYLLSTVRSSILERIPVIGALDQGKK